MLNFFTSRTCVVLLLWLLTSWAVYGQVGINLEDQVYAGPVKGATGIVFDNNGNLYINNVYGSIYRVKRGESTPTLWLDIREEVGNYGDHGLLGMTLDRDFLENGRFYLYYNVDMYWYKNVGKPGYDKNRSLENYPSFGRLTRYTANVKGDFSVDLNSRKVLIGETHDTGVPVLTLSHLGGGLAVGADGSILIGTGDGSSFEQVDVGCNATTWVDLAMQEGIIKYIPNPGTTTPESCSKPDYYDKNRVTENIGAYRAQALFSLSGKILRVNPENGDGLPSNPFYNASLGPRAAQNRVYAFGLRQAFRISVRPGTGSTNPQDGKPGIIYVGDVGFTSWEELNVITEPGQNFGWPYYEGILKGREGYWKTRAFEPANPVKPRIQWRDNKYTEIVQGETVTNLNKTLLEGGCAIGGAWQDGGGTYPAELKSIYYFADYNAGWIAGARFGHDNELETNGLFKVTKKIVTDEGGQRLTAVAFNPYDHNIYYMTFGEAGVVRRFVAGNDQPPVAVITKDKTYGNSPLTINFSAKESFDPEGKPLKYEWSVSDGSKSTAMDYTRSFTSTGPKSYTVTLKVTDEQNKTNSTQTVISVNNTPPIIQTTSVDNLDRISLSSPYTINLNATATDAESPTQLSYRWTVYLYHNDHRHVVTTVSNQTGSVTVSEGSCDGTASYWYGVGLDVTDASGLTTNYIKFLYLDCPGASQTINFASITDRAPTTPPFSPQVSATSGLPITLFAIEGPAFISNGQVNLTGGVGRVTIRATQHGNGQYRYAQPVERSFSVTNATPPPPDTQPPT
ncbi:PKD domain-containing protein, partial [Larkinella knui]